MGNKIINFVFLILLFLLQSCSGGKVGNFLESSFKNINSNKLSQNDINKIMKNDLMSKDKKLVKKKDKINVKFDSQYKDLLAFFRELEFQENIILFSDINIELIEENDKLRSKVKSSYLDVSLKMIVYGKI